MVSAKCTVQLSRSSTLASAAAIPPSAITVCALPKSDLQTSPTRTHAAEASIAARNPAPPAPITRTSYSKVSYSGMGVVEAFVRQQSSPLQHIWLHRLNDSEIVPDSHSAEPHVQICKADREQTQPCPKHVATVQTSYARISAITAWRLPKLIAKSPNQMS